MTFDRFELAIIDLAQRGVCLTIANVAAYTRVPPTRAEEWLDKMAKEGRLDVELDEDHGIIYYRVRGLQEMPKAMVPAPQHTFLQPLGNKSVTWGATLGLLLPGVGLLYAAPWSVALVGTLLTIASVKMLGALPLLGWLLSSVALGIAALASAVLGTLYVKQYNKHGRRTHLDKQQFPQRAYELAGNWTNF